MVDEEVEDEYVPLKIRRLKLINKDALKRSSLEGQCQGDYLEACKKSYQTQGCYRQEPEEKEEIEEKRGRPNVGSSRSRMMHNEPLELIKLEEERITKDVDQFLNKPLLSVKERSQGIHKDRMSTIYKIPRDYQGIPDLEVDMIRQYLFINVKGSDVPPPILEFKHMKLPKCILKALNDKGIDEPTPIQMQGLPTALLNRDIIGVASTGSGKTLVFVIPMLMNSWEMELRSHLEAEEGPFGMIVCPSRELALQTNGVVEYFTKYIRKYENVKLKSLVVIGGISSSDQSNAIKNGVHMIIATPGRVNELLNKKKLSLIQCRFICFDEADRLMDLGFDEEIRNIYNYVYNPRQTLLFSATMPKKIQEFAESALVDPVVLNVGRAGSASLNVTQRIELVTNEGKLPAILECLQKTGPPVLIFCENKRDVDVVLEYLLLKGIDAVAIHSGLSQEDRKASLDLFRSHNKDVLIGTDIVSKGLDFPHVQHVINFDLPNEIENYVHRIGRTGRGKHKGTLPFIMVGTKRCILNRLLYIFSPGLATTFVTRNQDRGTLLDLKTLLIEAKQEIPPFMEHLDAYGYNLAEICGERGCTYCGGLGHRIAQCPKLENQMNKQIINTDKISNSSRHQPSTDW